MATKYELSKTYQYRKVMKPLLERKRRARINKCLDDLKDLMAEYLQQDSGDPNVKLEKVDILELTVQHLRKLKTLRRSSTSVSTNNRLPDKSSFRSGYIQAANEVSRCLASQPNVTSRPHMVQLGTTLMTHLGLRLNQLEASDQSKTAINSPLIINCYNVPSKHASTHEQHQAHSNNSSTMYSPVSSGYASDNDYAYTTSSPTLPSASIITGVLQQRSPTHNWPSSGLLQVAKAPVWRPW